MEPAYNGYIGTTRYLRKGKAMDFIAAVILAATVVFAPASAPLDTLEVERVSTVGVKTVTVGGSAGFSL